MNDKRGSRQSTRTLDRRRHWGLPGALLLCILLPLGIASGWAPDPNSDASPPTTLEQPAGPTGVLTLVNNSTIKGRLGESGTPDLICWWGTEFTAPFQFRTPAIKSIKFDVEADRRAAQGEFAFEFNSGDLISGQLVDWTDQAIEIQSEQLGTVKARPEAIRRLHRRKENARSVFASLSGLHDWTTTAWDTSGWQEDGDHLKTDQPGATLNGDLRVPERAVVEFELAWQDKPDFVLAIGVDTESESDRPSDGWRLETVAGSLAIVREGQDAADVDFIADLKERESISLHAFLDQRTGSMQVLWDDGKLAGEISLPPSADSAPAQGYGHGVRLVNRGNDLTLQRLRIVRWLGKRPSLSRDAQASIATSDGSIVYGSIDRYDQQSASLVISESDHQVPIRLQDVVAIKLGSTSSTEPPSQCALFLHDGARLSGDLSNIDSQHWILSGRHLDGEVRVPRDQIRSMIVFQHDGVDLDPGLQLGRLGRLELGTHQLSGRLAPATGGADDQAPNSSCLHWHPLGSENAAPLKRTAAGIILYKEPQRTDASSAAVRALAMQRLRLQQQKRGLNFGKLFLERVDNGAAAAVERDAHVIHIRAGDVVACRIESIDQQGVHLTTVDSDHGFVPHAQVKAVEFVTTAPPLDLNEAKRQRLLTIPRLQKSSPPTHLLCSHTGDFLRCRLRSVDAETVTVEVQLEELTIPRERVARIIWFHPDELPGSTDNENNPKQVASAGDDSPTSFDGMVQVLESDGKRVTFVPEEITEKTIAGSSELLGACRFDLFKVDQLILGSRIGTEVSDVAFNRWKLQPAVEPLVAQMSADGPNDGSESPLVGLDAPDVRLELLDGGKFRISELKGQIIVLDFWASWCAPCMQTMPLLVEAMKEFEEDQVRLISINLEEPADHIRSVLQRHELNLTVALDLDGVAAAEYQARAIPQLVIVGPDGKVQRLYVGGGGDVVEQMKAAITELLE